MKIMSDLFLCDTLVHNIKLCRESDRFIEYKANIADGLCGIEMAMNEISSPRIKKMLEIAKDAIITHHFYIDLMAEVVPDEKK